MGRIDCGRLLDLSGLSGERSVQLSLRRRCGSCERTCLEVGDAVSSPNRGPLFLLLRRNLGVAGGGTAGAKQEA